MSGCSKGARGLFVLSRVLGILTETPISPSLWRRQRPSRYAIRAGRNLPDKEFRYLRTVIVTAAVYRGSCVFAKQSLGPILCDPFPLAPQGRSSTEGSPSPEVTGTFCRVPSPQVTRAPEATRLAYVCPFPVRSTDGLPQQAFLGSRLESASPLPKERLRTPLSPVGYGVGPGLPPPGRIVAPASPVGSIPIDWSRNVDLVPIVYALRPRLRVRLTRGG